MKKLMIVDDDRLSSSLLQALFELEGFEVTCVSEGVQLVSAVEEQKPSVVLLDFHLGSVESTALISQIRSNPVTAGVPVIVFSGEDKAAESLAAGADRFLIKPFNPSGLVDIVREMTH